MSNPGAWLSNSHPCHTASSSDRTCKLPGAPSPSGIGNACISLSLLASSSLYF